MVDDGADARLRFRRTQGYVEYRGPGQLTLRAWRDDEGETRAEDPQGKRTERSAKEGVRENDAARDRRLTLSVSRASTARAVKVKMEMEAQGRNEQSSRLPSQRLPSAGY